MAGIQLFCFMLLYAVLGAVLVDAHGENSTDSYWLLRIKSELDDPKGVMESWSLDANVCTWYGLTCSYDQVVGLNSV
ncbi:hypothetical protein L484_003279 [Morus notabilis]|uniref:Leucine-rich repeat-containing N-terminal plant-type domain-containing protein n=1 Tax=Morus notabilis TaxID=981085 RepID=W9S1L9_9ROSA|nr:hypothetical protein L484_003279 [Morus notabilis]